MSDRIIVRGGLILSDVGDNRRRWELKRIDLVVEDGKIVERSPDVTGRGDRVVNAEGLLVMPAFANAHTHAFEYGLKGFKSGRRIDAGHPEWFWAIYKSYTEELALLSADVHYAENLAAGVSVVGDVLRKGLNSKKFEARLCAMGLRGLVFDDEPSTPAYNVGEEIRPDLPQRLNAASTLPGTTVLHMHFMETEYRRTAGLQVYGQSVKQLLELRGLQSHRWVLTHCGAAKPSDLRGFDPKKTVVVVTPVAEARLGDPAADLQAISKLGLSVAIGTDGPCYNPRVDMFDEMRWLAYRHSLVDHRLDEEELLAMATNTRWIGGSSADLTFLRLDGTTLNPIVRRPYSNVIENLVWSATGSDVVGTLVGGQLLYWRGRWLEHDVEATRRRLTAQLSQFLADTVGGEVVEAPV